MKTYLVLIAIQYASSVSSQEPYPDFNTDVIAEPTVGQSEVQCSYDWECQVGFSCVDQQCSYGSRPCYGVCGENADCHLLVNIPLCACRTGYKGDPLTGCTRSADRECRSHDGCPLDRACVNGVCLDPCEGTCGLNTDCRVAAHRAVCVCKHGFSWSDTTGCYPDDIPECNSNSHCPSDKACLRQRCVDPCEGLCGENTVCKVVDHYPACACSQGFNGDPFLECKPLCLTSLKELTSATTSGYPYETSPYINEKRYFVSTETRDWSGAVDYCASRNMALVAIENEQEQAALVDFLQTNYNGGHDLWTSGSRTWGDQFKWNSSGNLVSFFNWLPDHPSSEDSGRNCIELRAGSFFKWATYDCNYNQYFVCQF